LFNVSQATSGYHTKLICPADSISAQYLLSIKDSDLALKSPLSPSMLLPWSW